jgi:cell division protein FtsB
MTDQKVLDDAKLKALTKEVEDSRSTIRNLSSRIQAQFIFLNDYLNANINFKSIALLNEQDINALRSGNSFLGHRIVDLEKENAELKAKVEELQKGHPMPESEYEAKILSPDKLIPVKSMKCKLED